MQGDNISTVGVNTSTVEGIKNSGGRILISACLTINNDEKYRYVCITKWNFHSEVSKILADFMPFENWTGVLQVQPCFEIVDNFIFGMLYLSFKFKCLCGCTWLPDPHGFKFMASWPSVVSFKFTKMPLKSLWTWKRFQRRKVPDRLWIIKITYLTGRTNNVTKSQKWRKTFIPIH